MAEKISETGRVTLRDVAERAQVSLATASKVMNARSDVRESTRTRVAEAARDLGYDRKKRDDVGRRTVLIVFDTLTSPYALQVLDGAVQAAGRAGVDLHVATSGGQREGEPGLLSKEWMRGVAKRGVSGVIAVTWPVDARHARWSAELSLPLIVVDPASTSPDNSLVSISATNWEGGSTAVQHLIDHGHRRIGVAAGPPHSVPARQRVQGYRSVLEQEGIAYDPQLVLQGSYAYEDGRRVGDELLGLADPPTAVFAVADTLAIGVLRTAREREVRVPEELSVVSFDDTLIATWANPQLTAVSQPLFSMGQVAVERLLALADDPGLFAHPFQLETRLVVRESAGPAPEQG